MSSLVSCTSSRRESSESAVQKPWDRMKAVVAQDSSQEEACEFTWDDPPSTWSRSFLKRAFDFLCVFCSLPLWVPVCLVVGLAVRLTSAGPVLFLQKRTGRYGRPFTILKFRTMKHNHEAPHQAVATAADERFTPIGRFLRRWKLDELPQLWNVLIGQMSLVGPRPKLPEHESCSLPCRPGITGAATLAFAGEEHALARIPRHTLDVFYNNIVLPAKRKLDVEYMAQATFGSDLKLIVDTVMRRWDHRIMEQLMPYEAWAVSTLRQPPQFVSARRAPIPFVPRRREPSEAEEESMA